MKRRYGIVVGPSLVLAVGILVSTSVATATSGSKWLVLSGPLVLALALAGAEALRGRIQGESARPSWSALILGASFLAASGIIALGDSTRVATMLPIFGAGAAVVTVLRPTDRREACGGL